MSKRIVWTVEVTRHLDDQLERYLELDTCTYKTKSEFIRDAVRTQLRKEMEDRVIRPEV